jgi:hypothetical protein
MFIEVNGKITNCLIIDHITIDSLISEGYIYLHYSDMSVEKVEGREAIEILMRLCPSALEGKKLKYVRHRWAIHNLIGHPLMQLLSWLHLKSLGLKVHDMTVPQPKGMHE